MSRTDAALAAAIDAVLTAPEVTYLRRDEAHPAPTEFGTRYDVVVAPAPLHVPGTPGRAAGAPIGPAVLPGGRDLDTPPP